MLEQEIFAIFFTIQRPKKLGKSLYILVNFCQMKWTKPENQTDISVASYKTYVKLNEQIGWWVMELSACLYNKW